MFKSISLVLFTALILLVSCGPKQATEKECAKKGNCGEAVAQSDCNTEKTNCATKSSNCGSCSH